MTFRQLYFALKEENNKYLTPSVIKEFLVFAGDFSSFTELFSNFDEEIKKDIDDNLLKLKQGYPMQYIAGFTYFLGDKILVDESTLIPRQETEQLVIELSKLIEKIFVKTKIKILDVCTGSGVIGIKLKTLLPNASLTLSDISNSALNVAKKNCDLYKQDNNIVESDMFNNINDKFDVIVCNPPYIKSKETIDEQVWEYEPHLALLAFPYTYFYEEVFKNVETHTNNKYILAFEIGEDMEKDLTSLINKYFSDIQYMFEKDIYGKTRFLYIIKNS